jgi:hypothetical protein
MLQRHRTVEAGHYMTAGPTAGYRMCYATLVAAMAATACAPDFTTEEASLQVHGLRARLSAEGARPVAKATTILSEKYGYSISYEDPRSPLLPGRLTFVFASADITNALSQLVNAQAARDGGGRFRVKQTGDTFHVVPTAFSDANGNWIRQESVLDIWISLPKQERTEEEMFQAICDAVSSAAHINMSPGMGAFGGGIHGEEGPRKYYLGADGEPARRVLMRALAQRGDAPQVRLTWHLYYGAREQRYILNIITVPDRDAFTKPTSAPMPCARISFDSKHAADLPAKRTRAMSLFEWP